MKKVITYGTFDLFHDGHRRLLERAKRLGDYLIVGITTDHFDRERGKLNTVDSVVDRIDAVRQTGLADKIIIEEYRGQKIDDIQRLGVDIFAIGSDWEGYFDYLKDYCEVVYLPRTEGVSSTQRRNQQPSVSLGVVGTGSIATRFVKEASYVSNVQISAVFNPDMDKAQSFAKANSIKYVADTIDDIFDHCDAVYIASPHATHYPYAKLALQRNKHVLCETPFTLKRCHAEELYELAQQKKLQLSVALKTAYCPAFCHLISLLRSRVIGDIVEVDATVTTLMDESSPKLDSAQYGGSMNENACFPMLPIFKLFGIDYKEAVFYSRVKNGVDLFTKAILQYSNAIASFKVGLGVKSEGDMTISGTKGYVYVPAPWWKTDYFEVRFEDQNLNKKYFYPFDGEGLRYEIKAFISDILSGDSHSTMLTKQENIAMAAIQEAFLSGSSTRMI